MRSFPPGGRSYPLLIHCLPVGQVAHRHGHWKIKMTKLILDLALQSLSNVFQKTVDELKQMLTASAVANWKKDPYSTGSL